MKITNLLRFKRTAYSKRLKKQTLFNHDRNQQVPFKCEPQKQEPLDLLKKELVDKRRNMAMTGSEVSGNEKYKDKSCKKDEELECVL